ncbi:putative disease resistance RPP13-like protein 1 [Neltuma alba]|uniref:putative disease resistance RPP13-like protein 1 n=1 Tax=Neltuma alba TaxID=207710 RepID=UPI0010A47EE9|nr:putative disease resistance RPP13-like protein 1 [Prosopis alba]
MDGEGNVTAWMAEKASGDFVSKGRKGVMESRKGTITNPKVEEWIDLVKDAVFNAEDVLDEIDYEVSKRKLAAEQESQISVIGKNASPSTTLAINLRSKIHLKELTLEWCTDDEKSLHDKDVLENFQPHKNLKKLSIGNYGGIGFPNWLADHSLSNVVSLELKNRKYCIALPSLGLFPSLKSLSITGFHSIVAIGPEFCGNSSNASSLEILRFGDMKGWEEWKCEILSLTFPHLQELSIKNCLKLKGGLPQQLPSLRILVISNCEKLLSSIPFAPSLDKLVLRDCRNE